MGNLKEELKKNGKKIEKIVNSPLNLRIPAISKVEVTAEQAAIDKAVAAARGYIAEIPGHMGGLVSRVQAIWIAPPEERAIRAKELKELEEEILAHLGAEDKLLGEAAKQAYVMAFLATLPANKEAILAVIRRDAHLPGLLKLGVLREVDGADKNSMVTVKVFGKPYMVTGGRVAEIAGKIRKIAGEAYGHEIEKIRSRADISIGELLAGKSGLVFISSPDGKSPERFLAGGNLLVKTDGREIRVVEFLGHFQKIMTEIKQTNIAIPIRSLSRDRLELAKRLPHNKFRLACIFHDILRRGVAEAQLVN